MLTKEYCLNRLMLLYYEIRDSQLEDKNAFLATLRTFFYRENPLLQLGNGYINSNSKIYCFNKITIGDGVAISEEVIIWDSDNHKLMFEGYEMTRPITIGNHVWIGFRAVILKGVTIGDVVVIAANALVRRDVPANCLVARIPTEIIKRDISWE